MSKYTLTYEKSKSQEIYVEGVVKDENHVPYFEQEYDEARKLIKEIVDSQGTKEDSDNEREKKREKIKKYGYNNRILFIGQRGCGKTSVMHSLADFLSGKNPKLKEKDGKDAEIKIKFSCLPMVDPSHFDNNNNILLTVITSMFSEAKRKMNKDEDDTSNREELLKQFEKVFKSLDSIKSELSSYTLESLNRKSDAEDLKDKMKTLVDKYLKFQGCGDESRLILLIDDIDMSVSYAPEMLEQLRKYLELDNLIILMSANLGQLSNEMREKYSSAFQYTLKDSNQALSIDVEDLATKYLLKLFPTSRRINVERHVDQLLKTDLVVEGWNKKTDDNQNDTSAMKDEGNFQKVILSWIWSKTRLLFIPKDPENTLHPIIPTNLRDLAQFLDMLAALKDVGSKKKDKNGSVEGDVLFASKKDYDECEHNLQVFKNYVMKTWIPNHLKVDEELVFHNIPSDITEINKHLINSINIIGTKHKDDLMSRQVGLDIIEKNADNVFIDRDIYTMVSPNDPKFVKANKISDIFNQPSNYSYGDLLLMIDKYETYFESEEHRKFTDAIKIYYSILLFETMFFKSNTVVFNLYERIAENNKTTDLKKIINRHTKKETINGKEEEFVKDKDLAEIANITKRLDANLEEKEKQTLISNRTSYLANFIKTICNSDDNSYKEDISDLINNSTLTFPTQIIPVQRLIGGNVYYPNYFEIITDKNFSQKGPSFDAKRAFYHKIEVEQYGNNVGEKCPFFAVLYYGDIRPDRYEKNHIYDTTFQTNSEVDSKHYVTFDILSILNNMLNPWQTISRLDVPKKTISMFRNWSEKIRQWGEINNVDGTHTPNAILPFYSVDIMLQYLSQSYQASKVIANEGAPCNADELSFQNQYKDEKELIKKGKELFLLSSDDDSFASLGLHIPFQKEDCINVLKNSNLEKYMAKTKIDCIKNGLFQEALLGKNYESCVNGYNEIINEILKSYSFINKKEKNINFIKCEQSMAEYFKNHQDIDAESKVILKQNLEILKNSYDRFRDLISSTEYKNYPEIIQELYLDYVVSLMMEYYHGSKKDRDGLIKDLHKFATITEIYKHLVEVLWENAITELLIRSDIQKKVRDPKSVQYYYKLLWEETQQLLEKEDIPLVVYENIYKPASNNFLS